jgi:nucleotide-binding universal stress UspA family protein
MQRIIVAVDGSAPSRRAVDLAADLAGKYDAEIVLVTVVPDFAPIFDPAVGEYARVEHLQAPKSEYGLAAAQSALDGAERAAQENGVARISTALAFGDPAKEIVAAAKKKGADLVVIGSRGFGRLKGLVLGSVAQKVLGHAPCPVLIVR